MNNNPPDPDDTTSDVFKPDPIQFDPSNYINGFVTSETTITSALSHPTFPFSIHIGGTIITLNSDGSWSGDIVEVKRAVAEMKGQFGDASVLMWLVLRQMIRDDERFW